MIILLNYAEYCEHKVNVLAILKVIESYNEKSDIFFFVTKAIHKNKDNCDQNLLKKMFKFVFYTIVGKTKLSGVRFVRLDSGREPDLSGSESDMYTVQAVCATSLNCAQFRETMLLTRQTMIL